MSSYSLTPLAVEPIFAESPAVWLIDQAKQHRLRYLLAHADDGVIWGRVDTDGLYTSHGIAPASPSLRASTLQQARLFSATGELLLWRSDDGWQARLVSDVDGDMVDWIDEDQILWGDAVEKSQDGFTMVREGSQGMRHAVPIEVSKELLEQRKLRLRVRHYIHHNDDGEARIILSRLVQLLPEAD